MYIEKSKEFKECYAEKITSVMRYMLLINLARGTH